MRTATSCMSVTPRLQRDLTAAPERAVGPRGAEAVQHVLREAEGHQLRALQRQAAVEEAAEIDMHAVAVVRIQHDVLACVKDSRGWLELTMELRRILPLDLVSRV